MPVMNINLFSITLRYGIDCMVVLPENLKKGEKLKCLWLYHGGSGDHTDRKSTRLNSSHSGQSRMPSSA